MQPAGGVHDHDVTPARLGGGDRIERHGRGIGARLGADEIDVRPLHPDCQLLDGGGAERIGGAHEHRLASRSIPVRELADTGGLAGAVDANDQDHVRPRGDHRSGLHIRQDALHHAADAVAERSTRVGAHRLQNLTGRRQTDVGGNQCIFQRFEALEPFDTGGAGCTRARLRWRLADVAFAQPFPNLPCRLRETVANPAKP